MKYELENEFLLFAENGELDKVKECVENGADIHTRDGVAIKLASREKHFEVVKYLIENGADIEHTTVIFDFMVHLGNLENVKYFVEKGKKIDKDDIRIASYIGKLEVVKYFVEQGADIDIAIKYANIKIKEELIDYKKSMEEKEILNEDLIEIMNNKTEPKEPTKPTKGIRV